MRRLWIFLTLSVSIAVSRTVAAADWPDGYIVYEESKSPDERYGILVPTYEAWEKDGSLEDTNYFANLKDRRLMGKIQGADYFEHQNHRGLKTIWAPDSSWCVVQYDGRFGFDSISILEPKDSNFIQTEIGKRIDKALATAIWKNEKSHDGEEGSGGDATTYFRVGANRSVQVRASSTTDPKELDPKHCRYGLFFGTFDLRSKKWLNAQAQRLGPEEYDATTFGDIDSDLKDESFQTQDEKAKWLDQQMNAAYTTARLILPSARFAEVKQEQIKWLKQRDAATSMEEKCNLMVARIKTLQELLW
jgi:uncharacterized protein YecT (DUF1311 family)